MGRITTFRRTTDRVYDGGPVMLYYNIRKLHNEELSGIRVAG